MVNTTVPLRISMVLFPGFTGLDMFGPLGALNRLSTMYPMTLNLLSTTLDPISIDRSIINGVAGAQNASPYFTQYILPTHTLDNAPEADVLFVPGGGGTRNLTATQPHVDWLAAHWDDPSVQYVMSVCTGASLLARTGKLAGRNATTNKAAFRWVESVPGAEKVHWVTKARWVVDGNVWTSSGVSAGTDMTLGWVEHVYGRNDSETMRIGMEWNALAQDDDPFAALYGLDSSELRVAAEVTTDDLFY